MGDKNGLKMKTAVCKICGKSLIRATVGYRSFRVCGEECYRQWISQIKEEIRKEMRGFKIGVEVMVR
jgi:hypothetical protein